MGRVIGALLEVKVEVFAGEKEVAAEAEKAEILGGVIEEDVTSHSLAIGVKDEAVGATISRPRRPFPGPFVLQSATLQG